MIKFVEEPSPVTPKVLPLKSFGDLITSANFEDTKTTSLPQLQRLLILRWLCQGTHNLGDEVAEKGEFSGTGACGRGEALGRKWRSDVRRRRRRGVKAAGDAKDEAAPGWRSGGAPGVSDATAARREVQQG